MKFLSFSTRNSNYTMKRCEQVKESCWFTVGQNMQVIQELWDMESSVRSTGFEGSSGGLCSWVIVSP